MIGLQKQFLPEREPFNRVVTNAVIFFIPDFLYRLLNVLTPKQPLFFCIKTYANFWWLFSTIVVQFMYSDWSVFNVNIVMMRTLIFCSETFFHFLRQILTYLKLMKRQVCWFETYYNLFLIFRIYYFSDHWKWGRTLYSSVFQFFFLVSIQTKVPHIIIRMRWLICHNKTLAIIFQITSQCREKPVRYFEC